jgi:hypothetical protein
MKPWMLFPLFSVMVALGSTPAPAAPNPDPAVMAACRGDAQRLCPGVKPGEGRIGQCMRQRMQEVSPQCLEAVRASRSARGQGAR